MPNIDQSSDKELLVRLQDGDHMAFEILYHRHSRTLLAKLDKKLSSTFEADDILQELFIKIWDRREQIDPEQPFAGYLYRIAQRMLTDHYRKLARTSVLHDQVHDYLNGREMEHLLAVAVQQLPAQQQRVFQLCKVEGKSYKETAQLMGLSTETVHAHLVKATKTVKTYILNNQQNISGTLAVALVVSKQFLT